MIFFTSLELVLEFGTIVALYCRLYTDKKMEILFARSERTFNHFAPSVQCQKVVKVISHEI